MNKSVAAIVVTYNRKDLLLENIECLKKQSESDDLDIIIIDNASTDGTDSVLQPYILDKSIIYINTGSNLGGAGGFNFGIGYAAKQQYKYLWIMDDDCMPNKSALKEFFNADLTLQGKYGFLSSKVLWKDNSICTMNIQRKTMFENIKDFSTPLVPCVMASFVSLFIPVKVVKKFGLPIKDFFIWTDDWEYTRRISRNIPCYVVNNSIVIHKSNSNIGAHISTDVEERLDRYKYLYRNDVYLYKREGIKGFLYECIRLLYHSLKVIKDAKNNKFKRLLLIWKSTIQGFSFKPSIEYISDGENR
ncbi:MAG: glycosyltransferase [Veillonella dispar]|jgi:GT2 family glycosyltransferase|nr:glycosyltransferase [Veillonella dispar]